MHQDEKQNPAGKAIMAAAFSIWGVSTKVRFLPKLVYDPGVTKAVFDTPSILICNHFSHKDGTFLPQILPGRKIYTLVTRKWYDKKNLAPFFRQMPYIPIDRNLVDATWLPKAEALLKAGNSILIFPEGHRYEDGTLGEFYPGFLLLKKRVDVPVIPLAICDDYKVFRRQRVRIGAPLALDVHRKGRPSQVLHTEAEKCREAVLRLRDG